MIEAKRLGLLREVKPGIETVGVLLNPSSATAPNQQKDVEEAARTIGLKVQFLKASDDAELEAAFRFIADNRIPALLVPADEKAAPPLSVNVTPIDARDAMQMEKAISEFASSSNGGLIVTPSAYRRSFGSGSSR